MIAFLKSCPGLSLKSIRTKVEALLLVASESLEMVGPNPAFSQILLSNIKLIFAINEQILQTKAQINEKAQSIPDYHLLLSIPGLEPTNATQILCEIGSINRFNNPKQFVAFCGIDP